MPARVKTKYPGVYYREAQRIGSSGNEKVFYIVFKKDGKVIEEKVGRQFVDNMSEAKAARIRSDRIEGKQQSRKEIRETREALKRQENNRWTLNRLFSEFCDNKPFLRGLNFEKSRYNIHIHPVLGDKEPQELSPFDFDRLRITLLKTYSPQTVRHILSLIKRIINYGVDKQLCTGLSFRVEMPHVDNKKTEDLNSEQLKRLLNAIDEDHDKLIGNLMKLALYTGMRRGELFRLQWKDIDFQRGFITILNPKGGKSQQIPLNLSARSVLENHPKTNSPYIFPGKNGEQKVDCKKSINRIKKRAGLPKDFRPLHGLRHVYASMLASSGQVDMYTLQKLLTHKSPLMTQRYAHLRDDTLKRASNLMGELVDQAVNGSQEKKIVNLDD